MSSLSRRQRSLRNSEERRDRARSLLIVAAVHAVLNLLAWVFVIWAIDRAESKSQEYWSIETRNLHIEIEVLKQEMESYHDAERD